MSAIGWIGLGDMGTPLARHVARLSKSRDCDFFIWSRTQSKATSFASEVYSFQNGLERSARLPYNKKEHTIHVRCSQIKKMYEK